MNKWIGIAVDRIPIFYATLGYIFSWGLLNRGVARFLAAVPGCANKRPSYRDDFPANIF